MKTSKFSTRITIAADHPVAALARITGSVQAVCMPGKYNGWQRGEDRFAENPQGDLEVEIGWNGNPTECKIAILGSPSDWSSGKWRNEASQKLATRV